jgi:hypothetical protein
MTPKKFDSLKILDDFDELVGQFSTRLTERVAIEGWPLTTSALISGNVECQKCKEKFGRRWLHQGLCWRCREEVLDQGRCPGEKNYPLFVCPHQRKWYKPVIHRHTLVTTHSYLELIYMPSLSFSCDRLSCSECRLERAGIHFALNNTNSYPTHSVARVGVNLLTQTLLSQTGLVYVPSASSCNRPLCSSISIAR